MPMLRFETDLVFFYLTQRRSVLILILEN